MKNTTLIFRSLAIIVFITGIAHFASSASQKEELKYSYEESIDSYEDKKSSKDENLGKGTNDNLRTDYIEGIWKVTYNSEDFKGAVVYEIKKEGKVFNAYTYQYLDEKGNAEKAENTKILTVKNFDGYKGKGNYTVAYEQQEYQVDCQIDMVDENTLKLSYNYYGYSDVETWKRQ